MNIRFSVVTATLPNEDNCVLSQERLLSLRDRDENLEGPVVVKFITSQGEERSVRVSAARQNGFPTSWQFLGMMDVIDNHTHRPFPRAVCVRGAFETKTSKEIKGWLERY